MAAIDRQSDGRLGFNDRLGSSRDRIDEAQERVSALSLGNPAPPPTEIPEIPTRQQSPRRAISRASLEAITGVNSPAEEEVRRNTNFLGDLGTAFGSGLAQVPSAVTGLADTALDITGIPDRFGQANLVSRAADALSEGTAFDFDGNAERGAIQKFQQSTLEGRQEIAEAEGFMDTAKAALTNPTATATMVTESIPAMLAGGVYARLLRGAVGISGLVSAAIGEGLIAAGMMKADTVDNEDVSGQAGALGAVATGTGVGLFGFLGGKVAAKLGVTDGDMFFAGAYGDEAVSGLTPAQQALRGSRKMAARIAGGAIAEGVFEEMPQSVFEGVVMNIVEGEPVFGTVGEDAALGLILGGAMGGAINILPLGRGQQPDDEGGAGEGGPTPTQTYDDVQDQVQERDIREVSKLTDEELIKERNDALVKIELALADSSESENQATVVRRIDDFIAVIDGVLADRNTVIGETDADSVAKQYVAARNLAAAKDEAWRATGLTPNMRQRKREAWQKQVARVEALRAKFPDEELMPLVAQQDYNTALLELESNKRQLQTMTEGTTEHEAARQLTMISSQKVNGLLMEYPDLTYKGSEAELVKAQTGRKPRADKASAAQKPPANTTPDRAVRAGNTEQAAATLSEIDPFYGEALLSAAGSVQSNAAAGLADLNNAEENQRLVRAVNNPKVNDDTIRSLVEKKRDAYDKLQSKGPAAARNKAAAELVIAERGLENRTGEAPPERAGEAATMAQPTPSRSNVQLLTEAFGQTAPIEGIEDVELDALIGEIEAEITRDPDTYGVADPTSYSWLKKKSRSERRADVRRMLERGLPTLQAETVSKGRPAPWKNALASLNQNVLQERGLNNTTALQQQRAEAAEQLEGQDQLEAVLVQRIMSAAQIEAGEEGSVSIKNISKYVKADGTLSATGKRAVQRYIDDPAAQPKERQTDTGAQSLESYIADTVREYKQNGDRIGVVPGQTPAPAPARPQEPSAFDQAFEDNGEESGEAPLPPPQTGNLIEPRPTTPGQVKLEKLDGGLSTTTQTPVLRWNILVGGDVVGVARRDAKSGSPNAGVGPYRVTMNDPVFPTMNLAANPTGQQNDMSMDNQTAIKREVAAALSEPAAPVTAPRPDETPTTAAAPDEPATDVVTEPTQDAGVNDLPSKLPTSPDEVKDEFLNWMDRDVANSASDPDRGFAAQEYFDAVRPQLEQGMDVEQWNTAVRAWLDTFPPFQFLAEQMAIPAEDFVRNQRTGNAYLLASEGRPAEEQDLIYLLWQELGNRFRVADMTEAAQAKADLSPIQADSIEATDLLVAADLKFDQMRLAGYFFNIVSGGTFTNGKDITDQIVRQYIIDTGESMNTTRVSNMMEKIATKLFEQVRVQRNLPTMEQAKATIPALQTYLATKNDDATTTTNAYWDARLRKAEEQKAEIMRTEYPPAVRAAEAETDPEKKQQLEWAARDIKIKADTLPQLVAAEKKFREDNPPPTKSSKPRSLFVADQSYMIDYENAFKGVFLESSVGDDTTNEVLEAIMEDEQVDIESQMEEVRDRVAQSVGRYGPAQVRTESELRALLRKRSRKATSLLAQGFTKDAIRKFFNIEAGQAQVNEAIREHANTLDRARINVERAGREIENDADLRRYWENTSLEGKPTYQFLLENDRATAQDIVAFITAWKAESTLESLRNEHLTTSRLRTLIDTGLIKPYVGEVKKKAQVYHASSLRLKNSLNEPLDRAKSVADGIVRNIRAEKPTKLTPSNSVIPASVWRPLTKRLATLVSGTSSDISYDAKKKEYDAEVSKLIREATNLRNELVSSFSEATQRQPEQLLNAFKSKLDEVDTFFRSELEAASANESLNTTLAQARQYMQSKNRNQLTSLLAQSEIAKVVQEMKSPLFKPPLARLESAEQQMALLIEARDEYQQQKEDTLSEENRRSNSQDSNAPERATLQTAYFERQREIREKGRQLLEDRFGKRDTPQARRAQRFIPVEGQNISLQDAVKQSIAARLKADNPSVRGIIKSLRTAYLHDYWVKLNPSTQVAIASDGAVYTIVKQDTGKWLMYRPASLDALPNLDAANGERVGHAFRTLKDAKERITDKDWLREQAYQHGYVYSQEEAAAFEESVYSMHSLNVDPETTRAINGLRNKIMRTVQAEVDRQYQADKKVFDEQRASGEAGFNTGGETIFYEAMQKVRDPEISQKLDIYDDLTALNLLLDGRVPPVTADAIVQQSLGMLYGPSPEPNMPLPTRKSASIHEVVSNLSPAVVTGIPADMPRGTKVLGLDTKAHDVLRQMGKYMNYFDTVGGVKWMRPSQIDTLLENHPTATDAMGEGSVGTIVRYLKQVRDTGQLTNNIRMHAPVVNIGNAFEHYAANTSMVAAWREVFGNEPMPVVLIKPASSTYADEFAAHNPKLKQRPATSATNQAVYASNGMKPADMKKRLKDMGFNVVPPSSKVKGGVSVVKDVGELATKLKAQHGIEEVSDTVHALYVNINGIDRIYIVANKVDDGSLVPVLAHELSHSRFSDSEVTKLAALVRQWAQSTDPKKANEKRIAEAAEQRVQGSLEVIRKMGREVTQRHIDQELLAYTVQEAVKAEGSRRLNLTTGEPSVAMKNYMSGKRSQLPGLSDTDISGFMGLLRNLFNKTFGAFGSRNVTSNELTANDIIRALTHKESEFRALRTVEDVLAAADEADLATNQNGEANIAKQPSRYREASNEFLYHTRKMLRALSTSEVAVENNKGLFKSVEAIGGNPLVRWRDIRVAKQREATVNVKKIHEVIAPLERMSTKRRQAINQFIEKSTRRKMWGYVPWPGAPRPEMQDPELMREFEETFNEQEQAIIKGVFRVNQELRETLEAEMEQEIIDGFDAALQEAQEGDNVAADTQAVQNAIDAAIEEFRKQRPPRQAAYAKLQLQGKYAVVYKSPEYRDAYDRSPSSADTIAMKGDPDHYFVAFGESRVHATALRNKMIRDNGYPAEMVSEVFERKLSNFGDEINPGLLANLEAKFESYQSDLDPTDPDSQKISVTVNQMRKAMQKLYIQQLTEDSLRKSELGSDNVPTYSQDMVGNFAQQGRQYATHIAAVKTNRESAAANRELIRQAQTDAPGRGERMAVLNEILKRNTIDTEFQESPLANKWLAFTSFKTLLTSPAYYMQNATQPFMYSMPQIAGDTGRNGLAVAQELVAEQARLAKLWMETTSQDNANPTIANRLTGTLFNPELIKDPEERGLLKHLEELNLYDVGMTADVGRLQTPGITQKEGALTSIAEFYRKAFAVTNGGVRTIEILNRGSSALVAYRSHMQSTKGSGKSLEQRKVEARDYAVFVIRRTQGDYSFGNQPSAMRRIMGVNVPRFAVQFRTFQLIQYTILAQEFKRAFLTSDKAEKAAGRRVLMYLAGSHFTAAGALGLPLMGSTGALGIAIAAIMGDDEEPSDLEYAMYKKYGNNAMTDFILHGPAALLGIETTSKLGMGQGLIAPYLNFEMTREYPALYFGTVALGATGGMLGDAFAGVNLMSKGFVVEGAAKAFAPRGMRDAIFAMVEGTEGRRKINMTKDVLVDPEDISIWQTTLRGLGWSPMQLNMSRGINRWGSEVKRNVGETSTELKGRFVEAVDNKDNAARMQVLRDWQEFQRRRVQLGLPPQSMKELTGSLRDRNRRVSRTTDTGVQYDNTYREFFTDFNRQE